MESYEIGGLPTADAEEESQIMTAVGLYLLTGTRQYFNQNST